jgi:adsorption protein B
VWHRTSIEILALVEHELLLFSAVFFLLGALDELAVDFAWLWLRVSGRQRTWRIDRREARERPLGGPAAVLIPAWHEEQVIGFTIAHALAAWPHRELCLYVGCYRNDAGTVEAVRRASRRDPRVRQVILPRDGPTTKADCLNWLYATMDDDERRSGRNFRLVVLHDAEDMIDPAALGLLDRAVDEADFVQLPVLPEPQRSSRLVGSHYCEEFAEAHGKLMVVRGALSAGLPAAGVGCAFSREILRELARQMGGCAPFSAESLTEDYGIGLRIKAFGGRSLFLRARGEDGRLVATRACFPARLPDAVRQKSRWIHGIALQGWDRLGWSGGVGERWMRLRDRRGPMSALVLLTGYIVLAGGILAIPANAFGLVGPWRMEPWLATLLAVNFAGFAWRSAVRFAFTVREYGLAEGTRAIGRIPVANLIAILAGGRALLAYVRTLCGEKPSWEKTFHHAHPAAAALRELAA